MVENQEACNSAPLDDSKVDSYIAPCPMGFEHVMIDAVMYSLEKAGFGDGKSEVAWLFSPSEDKLKGMRVQVAKQLQLKEEKRLKKKDIEKSTNQTATCAVSEGDHSVIVGPLNDGSNLFLGQYEGNAIVSRPGATEVGIHFDPYFCASKNRIKHTCYWPPSWFGFHSSWHIYRAIGVGSHFRNHRALTL